MRPLVIANVEHVEKTPFLVALLYGEDGYLLDEITLPYEGPDAACGLIAEIMRRYRLETVECWTSEQALYVSALSTIGIAVTFKHRLDTGGTREAIERSWDILAEIYELKPKIRKPKTPKWRLFFIGLVQKILNKLKGDGLYEEI